MNNALLPRSFGLITSAILFIFAACIPSGCGTHRIKPTPPIFIAPNTSYIITQTTSTNSYLVFHRTQTALVQARERLHCGICAETPQGFVTLINVNQPLTHPK